MAELVGDYIQTISGIQFYPFSPTVDMIEIEDIAHAQSNMCRFNGHTVSMYPLAQHSVLAAENVPPEYALEALLHDGSEGFISDIARPLKKDLPQYVATERGIEMVISQKYNLPWPMSAAVKEVDTRLLVTEARQLLRPGVYQWWTQGAYADIKPLPIRIRPWSPKKAKRRFMYAFETLTSGKKLSKSWLRYLLWRLDLLPS